MSIAYLGAVAFVPAFRGSQDLCQHNSNAFVAREVACSGCCCLPRGLRSCGGVGGRKVCGVGVLRIGIRLPKGGCSCRQYRRRQNRLVWVGCQRSDDEGAESGRNEGEERLGSDAEGQERREAAATSSAMAKEVLVRGVLRFGRSFCADLKRDTGIDLRVVKERYDTLMIFIYRNAKDIVGHLQEFRLRSQDYVSDVLSVGDGGTRLQLRPLLASWDRWVLWKDLKRGGPQRIGALVMYTMVVAASFWGLYAAYSRRPLDRRSVESLANAYMEAAIPEPTPQNVRKLRKGLWRKNMPKGFSASKHVQNIDGEFQYDRSFIGENPWEDSEDEKSLVEFDEILDEDTDKIIDEDPTLSDDEKETLKVLTSAAVDIVKKARGQSGGGNGEEERHNVSPPGQCKSWQERLVEWEKALEKEELNDYVDSLKSEYDVSFDWAEIQKNFIKQREKGSVSTKSIGYLIARKWWKYRPKLPYTYFLSKVESLEVQTAVYSEDLKKLFVRMKDGFPSEYIVDVPVDPYLYGLMSRSRVELDIIHRSSWYYFIRALAVLSPGVLIIFCYHFFSASALNSFSEQIYDLIKSDRKHLILPGDAASKSKTGYNDVVMGGDVWKVFEEIMVYMRNPMRYHDRKVKLPRGILMSGPPGTGKTLLARAIARESGLPFIFASGADFVESSQGYGANKVFDIFFTARANAPSFIFIDEIDAIAGRGVYADPERKHTFEQLLAELDGEPEDTDVDRFSLRQAVILICATNRPDELDERLLLPGRIDRQIHIGLPGEEERVAIFEVHSVGRPIAKDIEFSKLVYRTVGFSGADIRNLINEAGIMAVGRGRVEIKWHDFIDVLDKQLFEGMGLARTEEEEKRAEEKVPLEYRRLMAVHEAGHVLLAHLFPQFDWHAFTHLLPGGREAALSLFYPREEMLLKGYTTVGYLKMQMVVAHGGRCAERLVFGDVSDGGQDDLARISKLAREIAIGQSSPRLGLFPMVWKDRFEAPKPADEEGLIPNNWNGRNSRIAKMSVELSEMFTREITRYIDETEEQAMKALVMNHHILDSLADELLQQTKITGVEVAKFIRSMNPIMMEDPLHLPDMKFDIRERLAPPNSLGRYEYLDIYQAPLHRC
eukprot:c28250_g1_i1 orf=123-3467(+)